jgi:hypothetical protein
VAGASVDASRSGGNAAHFAGGPRERHRDHLFGRSTWARSAENAGSEAGLSLPPADEKRLPDAERTPRAASSAAKDGVRLRDQSSPPPLSTACRIRHSAFSPH